ncbi:MAG TPA: AAA family ATPase [Streptosporangiaceae bacterium]|nr:AAA family ATPase [Streptosporangiaceae bacterium]
MPSMLSPVLIGRDAELRTLVTALDAAATGSGRALFLTGDPGVGKSRLAAELSAVAQNRGFASYRGRAVQSASPVPFRPITEALMQLGRSGSLAEVASASEYRSVLATLVPELGQPGRTNTEVNPLTVAEALLRVLALTGTGSILILEDLHWADPETLATVDYLADNLAGRRVMLVATLRDDEQSAGLDMARSIIARRSGELIEVPRLTEREVEEMVGACLDADRETAVAATRLLAHCDGLPFAVEEVLAAAVASGELEHRADGWHVYDGVITRMPDSIVGSVQNRLAALKPQAAEVIVAAAVLGRQFDWTLLPAMCDVSDQEVISALAQARAVQLIEPHADGHGWLRFRHSLTRAAIISALLPPDLARRSAAAASAVESAHPGLPSTWCELAADLYETAGQHADSARLLLEAGHRALVHGAVSSAAETLSQARAQLGQVQDADPGLAADVDERLVKALALAGDNSRLAPVAEEAVARLDELGTESQRQARILLMAARTESEGDPESAAAHLSAAREIADRLGNPITSSWADAVAARCAIDAGELESADVLAQRSLASAEAAGLEGWAAEVAFESLEVIGRRERVRDLGAARAAFERAATIAEGEEFAVRRISALHELGTIDMIQGGDTARLSEASELARQAGAVATATAIDLQLANIWCLGTDLNRAMGAARRCEQGARMIKAPRIEALALAAQALIFGVWGDRKAAKSAAGRAEHVLPGDAEVLAATWGQDRVVTSLFRDEINQAAAESAKAIEHLQRAPQQTPRRAWAFYALLQATTGKEGQRALERARTAGAAVGWNEGWLAYAQAVLEGRAGHARRASALAAEGDEHFRSYAPWWTHLARRLVVSDAIKDSWGHPPAWMREATREFDANGQHRLASACRVVLRQAGERAPRTGRGKASVPAQMRRLGVTSREMDVILLLAQGLSNADIAAKLFISPKTVETHIANLVSKTGQTGRRDLAANAGRFARS